jgi:hypothetical protein
MKVLSLMRCPKIGRTSRKAPALLPPLLCNHTSYVIVDLKLITQPVSRINHTNVHRQNSRSRVSPVRVRDENRFGLRVPPPNDVMILPRQPRIGTNTRCLRSGTRWTIRPKRSDTSATRHERLRRQRRSRRLVSCRRECSLNSIFVSDLGNI